MAQHFDFIVGENSVGAMIAALTLAEKHKVALLNPTPNWGGIFGGIKVNGTPYDIGMVFFEFSAFHSKSDDLLSYNPEIRNDSARFFHLVEDFFAKRIAYEEIDGIKCWIDGVMTEDILIANQLDILQQLKEDKKAKIKAELAEIVAKGDFPLHARHKKNNEALFLNTSYDEVGKANHGETLHHLLSHWLTTNIFNLKADEIPALLHRIAWLPLYYPETLLAALEGNAPKMPATVFHYPKADYFAKSIEILSAEIEQHQNITVFRSKIKNLERDKKEKRYTFSLENQEICTHKLVWGSDIQKLLQWNGHSEYSAFDKASITLAFVEVPTEAVELHFSTLFSTTTPYIYRVTNQDYLHSERTTQRFVFEISYDYFRQMPNNTDEDLIVIIQQFLSEAKIFNTQIADNQIIIRNFINAINKPTLKNLDAFAKIKKDAAMIFDDVLWIGPGADFAATSFNDQVVQALQLGKKYN